MTQGLIAMASVAAILMIANLLIFGHELGHFAAARIAGIPVRHFTIGFGPALARWQDRRGTTWTIGTLPLGGFVSFAGETDVSVRGGYAARHPAVRLAVIIAGPAANLVLAIAIYAGIVLAQGESVVLPTISTVEAGSAAETAGFRPGDKILAAAGTPVTTFDALRPILQNHPGARVSFEIARQGVTVDLTATLGTRLVDGRATGYLGVSSRDIGHRAVSPSGALEIALVRTWHVITDTVSGIAGALSTGRGGGNFAGMLEVAHLAGQAAMTGLASLFVLTAVLSVNLALMNMLPIPVLDGGAFIFTAIEWARGKPTSPHVLDFATRSGVAVIATMFFASTLHDLAGFGLFRWLF